MSNVLLNIWRLSKAGRTLAAYGALLPAVQQAELSFPARILLRIARLRTRIDAANSNPLAAALVTLGPSYIKLGQFLATRSDIVGDERARDLTMLQDKLKPFSQEEALKEISKAFGVEPRVLFARIEEPVAAASIAQVH
jgi:ubiquinone biosynthesis protein